MVPEISNKIFDKLQNRKLFFFFFKFLEDDLIFAYFTEDYYDKEKVILKQPNGVNIHVWKFHF